MLAVSKRDRHEPCLQLQPVTLLTVSPAVNARAQCLENVGCKVRERGEQHAGCLHQCHSVVEQWLAGGPLFFYAFVLLRWASSSFLQLGVCTPGGCRGRPSWCHQGVEDVRLSFALVAPKCPCGLCDVIMALHF